jgi:hypothetical protein
MELGIGKQNGRRNERKGLTELLCPGGVKYFQYDLSTLNLVG